MQPISNEIVQDDDVHVGLLIEGNCMKALEPTRIFQIQDGGPYVYKTRLGWCVAGPINCTAKNCSTSCNRVAVKDVASSKLGSHHFTLEDSVKYISLEEIFQRMYKQDFSRSDSILKNVSEISCDDRKCLDIFERRTVKRNGHYVVPLPFRDQELVTPNNKQQAVKRLMSLKRRFIRDKKFFLDYKKYMNDLLEKGYARRCNETPTGKTWYIPHHALYHPSKPGKIRVVFDCSAEFEGKSINKDLLPGPDLTNQIVSILIRFCEERVAVMDDVESMYYQVQVPENQQTYLKFLWWENHDIECHPQEFVMCAHLFGGTSSGGCSNYALRRTAVDNEAEFGRAAASTLLKNFCVDEFLKSVGNINIAKQLVKDVISMCRSGGFNLAKFVSNSNELLQSIPEQQRRQETKDKDLSGDLPLIKH